MTTDNKKEEKRGRKVTKEYFKDFDKLKEIGDKFVVKIDENRFEPKQYQMKVINQARSYSKHKELPSFKVMTRIVLDELEIRRIS